MAAAARDRAKRAAGTREALLAERARIGELTPESLAAARARLGSLAELRREIDEAIELDVALAEAVTAALDGAARARAAVVALAAIHPADDVRALTHSIDEARAAADVAYGEVIAAENELTECEAMVAALPPLDALRSAAEAHVARAETIERIGNGEAHLANAVMAVTTANDDVATARAALEAAQVELEQAQRRHAHAELRATLRKGEPCPVCEQAVSALPPKLRTTVLTAARKAVEARRAALDKAEPTAHSAVAALAKSEALLDTLRERLHTFDAQVETFPCAEELARVLGDTAKAHERADAARSRATAARVAAQAAADRVAGLDDAVQRAEADLQQRRDALIAAGVEPPPSKRGAITNRWDALSAWADETRPDYEKNAAQLDDVAVAKKAEQDALYQDVLARAVALDIAAPGQANLSALAIAAVGAQHDAANEVQQTEAQLARAQELDKEIVGVREHEMLAAELGRLLDKAHFGQWLVDEALRALVAGASVMLERLSGGQYALTTDSEGDLVVVDHVNADQTRSVRSLSGGETFQASLALALALADRIADLAADGAPALESVFLDEGFGTLDPETLDVVAGTVESLGAGERVVGVVTHVADLAERMPVRFRVRKVGRTSTVTREDA
jgi:exonuclease SbcC